MMTAKYRQYKALVSSDWNECLAPCGPFDFISFTYPELESDLESIFEQYTGNIISLGEAVQKIQKLLPGPLTEEHMDAYLNKSFATYKGVAELIEWCLERDILFMINTTGMIGYFQRVFSKGLLPTLPVISAHPMVRYAHRGTDPLQVYDLLEIQDKSKNTGAVADHVNIPGDKIILIGDSGGDGPHFDWGAGIDAHLIGSMTKPSLEKYCQTQGVDIDLHFGLSYAEGDEKDPKQEMQIDFRDLSPLIEKFLSR
jgi:2-hydroxy-3-keto-5-methylthiopentenyl-1-phosphate phosphatase